MAIQPTRSRISAVPRETFVIVGGGQAGAEAAVRLRETGFRGRVVLLGEEPYLPYMRPPLSKKFMAGDAAREQLFLRPKAAYDELGVELKIGLRVEGIDRAAGVVRLENGLRLAYDKLLLATGCRARSLTVPGANGPGVQVLRSLNDANALRNAMRPGGRVAIIGAGYLGLEVAAAATRAGARVHVLEQAGHVLSRVTGPETSAHFSRLHHARGVHVRCDARVVAFEGTDGLENVVCDDGRVRADVALVAAGAIPNDILAREAGLACDDGILVDEYCRTSDAAIFAAGDCTRHPSPLQAAKLRLESVQNAVDQAAAAAVNMCDKAQPYRTIPWFWSQQFEHKLQTAGLVTGYDEVRRISGTDDEHFTLRYHRNGQLVAVEAVNMPGEYLKARREMARAAGIEAEHGGRRVA